MYIIMSWLENSKLRQRQTTDILLMNPMLHHKVQTWSYEAVVKYIYFIQYNAFHCFLTYGLTGFLGMLFA